MIRRISFALLWLGFITYAFVFAPPDQPDTLDLIKSLSLGQWDGINPLIIALFNIMGIWPVIYSVLLFRDGQQQKIPAWPFAVGSFALGAFALLPYLVLREPITTIQPKLKEVKSESKLLQILESRWLGIGILIGVMTLLTYGFGQGNWSDFVQQWQTNRFIHVMSLDFCMLAILFPTLLGDDMKRQGISNPVLFWVTVGIPLLGSTIYLLIRDYFHETTQPI
ncbi:DUF2834 domain-containing protein [Crocosphaera sp. UHCC 0190]|uniref:DUF2834 domain-containing protein n=1 Tax=Crocosphaera sp. UHCC 0190 TaxID=3110246 RepID=UPI002B2127B5|nr:DUF2834 domain-containing protein [Crocosphaera sp. UHCC 0190]MEA5512235.1 DUF2834 domain-containing protein [Crocosphaera sp. UHCC 0190]